MNARTEEQKQAKMGYLNQLMQELADIAGIPVESMAGCRVMPALREAEASGATIYWGCVASHCVTNADRF